MCYFLEMGREDADIVRGDKIFEWEKKKDSGPEKRQWEREKKRNWDVPDSEGETREYRTLINLV